jgi:hypothetical protein
MRPAVSVIVVSDYAGGDVKAWDDLRSSLGALARQDIDEPIESLLVESSEHADQIPDDLTAIVPSLKVVACPAASSYALKNEGVRVATAEFVVLLDADCTPSHDWLRRAVESMRAHPEAAAISGRTRYGGRGLPERVLAVLSRAYLDPGGAGSTPFISNNNAILRRTVLLEHPLPTNGGPFAARMQSEAIRRTGGQLLFEPTMCVVHEFAGWAMERDIRRNIGYGTIRIRQLDPRMPWAWMARLGIVSIPLFVLARTVDSCWDALRAGRHYGVRWFEQPLAFALAFVVHLLEIGGMLSAFRHESITTTAYR